MKGFWIYFLCISFTLSLPSYAQNDMGALSTQLLKQVLENSSSSPSPNPSGQTSTNIPEPTEPAVKGTSSPQNSSSPPPRIENLPKIHGTIVSSSHEEFEGDLYFPEFSLSIHQSYQGKDFLKILPSSQIKTLTCTEWTAFPYRQQLHTFQFVCTLFNIQDREGHNYVYQKVIPALSQIPFKNEKGTSLFYFYFVDYEKQNRWENLKIPLRKKSVSQPLEGVIRSIILGEKTQITPTPKTPESLPLPPLSERGQENLTPTVPVLQPKQNLPKKKMAISPPPRPKKKLIIPPSKPKVQKKVKLTPKKPTIPVEKKPLIKEKEDEKIPIRSRR